MPHTTTLTSKESQRLRQLEHTIDHSVDAFLEVGRALIEIQASRLYRAQYATFEAYVSERWDLERNYAYKFIAAAKTRDHIAEVLEPAELPTAERHYREIARAPTEQQIDVVRTANERAAIENRKPTAQDFRDVVDELRQPEDVPQPKLNKGELALDNGGIVGAIATAAAKVERLVRTCPKVPGTERVLAERKSILAAVQEVRTRIDQLVPSDLCDHCGGKGCRQCGRRGYC